MVTWELSYNLFENKFLPKIDNTKETKPSFLNSWTKNQELRINPFAITISWLNWDIRHDEEQFQHCEKPYKPGKNSLLGENQ